MRRFSLFWVVFVVLIHTPVGAEGPFPPIEEPPKSLPVGERLVFDVVWMGFPIGSGTLEVKDIENRRGRPAWHVVATARSNWFLSSFYPVEDEIHSWIDVRRLRSLEFRKKLKEGRYRADEQVLFDYDKGRGYYESFHNGTREEFPIRPVTHDLVSAFYWFRLQPIGDRKRWVTLVNQRGRYWTVQFMLLDRVRKEIRGRGTVDTLLIEPKTRLKGALYDRGRAWVFMTADSSRMPVWITLKTPFGPVVGVLKRGHRSR